ncbi:MAG TPA: iron-sulfur cluster repair protein YtfE [Vicinamibacterales bacterium]|nr:iron-sulfur cluster repair protein YtfE [Vicinamibacterales bacterium]
MTTSSTLAELATTHPAASRVFQRYRLDYCCGGRQPLDDVCNAKGIDPKTIVEAIEAEETAVDLPRWDNAPLSSLINLIVSRYHAALRSELPALIALADRVETRHATKASCPHGLRAHLDAVLVSVAEHLEKEETVLFPLILSGHGYMAAGPVRVMQHEHEDHGRNLARIRELTNNLVPPAEACATWRALYLRLEALENELMDHIHLENNVLFPRALRDEGAE